MATTRRTKSRSTKSAGTKPARSASSRGSSRDKVRAHRERLRKMGLRPIQIWVPDTSSEAFAREAHRQSRLIAQSPGEPDDQAFVDAISEWPDV